MTKGEARGMFLRYLGEATVNGQAKNDPDLADTFDWLLPAAIMQVGGIFPALETCEAGRLWTAPEDFVEITQTRNSNGDFVDYMRLGKNKFRFFEPCSVEYARVPHMPAASEGDAAVLDVDARAVHLVPIQAAIYAAQALREYAWRVPYLSAMFGEMSSVFTTCDKSAFRRVHAI